MLLLAGQDFRAFIGLGQRCLEIADLPFMADGFAFRDLDLFIDQLFKNIGSDGHLGQGRGRFKPAAFKLR